jgi:hypothetical protein
MKKETLLLLGIVGLGLYFFYKNKKSVIVPSGATANPNEPQNDTGTPIEQKLDANSRLIADNSYRAYFSLSGYKKLGNIPNTI